MNDRGPDDDWVMTIKMPPSSQPLMMFGGNPPSKTAEASSSSSSLASSPTTSSSSFVNHTGNNYHNHENDEDERPRRSSNSSSSSLATTTSPKNTNGFGDTELPTSPGLSASAAQAAAILRDPRGKRRSWQAGEGGGVDNGGRQGHGSPVSMPHSSGQSRPISVHGDALGGVGSSGVVVASPGELKHSLIHF